MVLFSRGKSKKKKQQQQRSEREERFIRVYKLFLETLISIFYPIRLEWWEVLISVVMGVLFGLGIGYVIRHTVVKP